MNIVAVIPSRYDSTRLPGKPLKLIKGKPMIQWVYEAAQDSNVFSEVIVATDDKRIMECVKLFNGKVLMTKSSHISGTDRVAEVAMMYKNVDVVANIQGDQPFITKEIIQDLIMPYKKGDNPDMTTVACPLKDEDYSNPNVVKVLCNKKGQAIYFSRAAIPYYRNKISVPVFAHLGLYAFRRDFLISYATMHSTPLEKCEGLEQLRAIENGYKIQVVPIKKSIIEINTYEDLEIANRV